MTFIPDDMESRCRTVLGCIAWLGGRHWHNRQPARILWEIEHEAPLQRNKILLRTCANSRCIAPAHHEICGRRRKLYTTQPIGTLHCRNGHTITLATLLIDNRGRHICRICKQLRNRKYADRKRQERDVARHLKGI